MAKTKMKKSNVRGRSQRSIEMEQARLAEEEKIKEEKRAKQRKKQNMVNNTLHTMFGIYSMMFSLVSILIDFMGIVGLIGGTFGLVGFLREKDKKPLTRYFWFSIIGMVLGYGNFLRFVWMTFMSISK